MSSSRNKADSANSQQSSVAASQTDAANRSEGDAQFEITDNRAASTAQRILNSTGRPETTAAVAASHESRSEHKASLSTRDIPNSVQQFRVEPATTQNSAIIQRIIVIPNTELDFGMIVNVYQMLTNGIDNRVTLLDRLGDSDIKDEQIGLEGHGYGESGDYGGMEAGELAELLKTAGVNESNTVIDLLSCNSGKGGGDSYAAQLAAALGNSADVYANSGLGVVMDDGYTYSKEPSDDDMAVYEAIITECASEKAAAEAIATTAAAAIMNAENTEVEIRALFLKYGAEILEVAGNLFQKLYAFQSKLESTEVFHSAKK